MPHANIWIRKEDSELWEKVPNKSEFISRALNGQKLTHVYVEQTMPGVGQIFAGETCKAGHLLGKNGKCLQKGCKYS